MLFPKLTKLILVLILHLGLLVAEILLLRLDDHMELSLFALDLFYEFLKVRNLLEILDLLRSNLLVKQVLLFLVSDLAFKLTLTHEHSLRIQI